MLPSGDKSAVGVSLVIAEVSGLITMDHQRGHFYPLLRCPAQQSAGLRKPYFSYEADRFSRGGGGANLQYKNRFFLLGPNYPY